MSYPRDRQYTRDHEWAAKADDGVVTVGITSFAQDQLGDITLVELPEVGDEVEAGESFGTVDSVKTFSDLLAPMSGTVVAINDRLIEEPELLNADPHGEAWLIKIEAGEEAVELLDGDAYDALVASLT